MTDHLIVATAADEKRGYYDALQAQVCRAGIDFIWQPIVPFSWRKLVLWELAIASSYPDALIAFCDSWDEVFLGSRREFETVLGAQPLLFNSEKLCWPHPEKAGLYPPCDTPWRYVNGTAPAGLGSSITDALEYGMDRFPIIGDGTGVHDITVDNDQRFWTDVYLAGTGKLDTECRLSQSLVMVEQGELAVKGGRLVNKITGSKPLFVHANGASAMLGQRGLMDILATYQPEKPW